MLLRTRGIRSAVGVFLVIVNAACARSFRASSQAQQVPGSPNQARASASGVTLQVEVDSWNGDPANLNTVLTPVKVSITNESERAVSLRYQNFTLSNPSGVSSSALPPFEIRGATDSPQRAIVPDFTYRNFMLYPPYRFYGSGLGYWGDNWGYDAGWYNSFHGYWQRTLPTADMLRKAIPEGVLNPGGSVAGYLFFQRVPESTPSVQLQASLMDARSHRKFGTIRMPFERKGS
jgi:hypothetical protein